MKQTAFLRCFWTEDRVL